MNRTRLRNRYLKLPSAENKDLYKRQRNLCTSLIRKGERTLTTLTLRMFLITRNFGPLKPFFCNKIHASHKITLINDNSVVSESIEIAEIFNEYFSTAAINLDIEKKLIS